jgi:hypothetical protein
MLAALRAAFPAAGILAAGLARRIGTPGLATHAAAGAAGALLVLLIVLLIGPRTAGVAEGALERRSAASAAADAKLAELSRAVAALGEAQAALARESRRPGDAEVKERLAKLEEGLAGAALAREAGQPQPALVARLTELEKSLRETSERVTASLARFDAELAASRADGARLADRLGSLRQETEEQLKGAARAGDVAPILTRLAAMDRDLKALLGGEADRAASASRLILGLELANLKRAVDRGEDFSAELARLRRSAGSTLDLAALERHMRDGAPSLQDLAAAFPAAANAMLDADQASADAPLLDRLLASARSVVRIRKVGHASGDSSTEAVIERMQTALRQGRLGDALVQAKALPPKAALAGGEWIGKAQARLAVDEALADVEAALKTSLAGSAARDGGR